MKYYMISPESKLSDVPQIINWYAKLNVEDVKMDSYYKLQDRTLLNCKTVENGYFPEVLFHPCFMVSKEIKKILALYEPVMIFKKIILLDSQNEKASEYFIPCMDEIDCLDPKESSFTNFNTQLENGAILRNVLGETSIFYFVYGNKKYYVARQDVLESMLRRDAILRFKELKTV